MNKSDLVGLKFARLLVLSESHRLNKKLYWLCKCDCGNVLAVQTQGLKSGNTKSCGCLKREITSERNTTHGLSSSQAYRHWQAMKQRCNYTRHKDYSNYGGRGIKVCDSWLNNFEQFYIDMGEPDSGMSLERKDNNQGYSKDNCIWIPMINQCKNKRSNVYLEHDGKRQTVSEWAKELGINRSSLIERLENWSLVRALTEKKFASMSSKKLNSVNP